MYTNVTGTIQQDGRLRLSGPCVVTGRQYSVVVSEEGMLAYFARGVKAKEAFPELSKEEREFLISGASPEGWRILWGSRDASYNKSDFLRPDAGSG